MARETAVPAQPITSRQVRIGAALAAVFLLWILAINAIDPRGFDFASLYACGTILRHEGAAKVYDLREQVRAQQELGTPGFLVGIHPPFEVVLYAPLSRLAYRSAYVLWGALNVLVWWLFQSLMRPHAPLPKNSFQYFMLSIFFFPLWVALIQGQPSIILLLCFSLCFIFLKRHLDLWGGVFLGLGLFKFPIVLPFALICLLRGRWKLIAGFALTAAGLGAVSLGAFGFAGVRSYVMLLLNIVQNPGNPAFWGVNLYKMATLRGFFTWLAAGRVPLAWLDAWIVAASAFLVLFVAWQWRPDDLRNDHASADLMFAAAVVVSLMVSPHLYSHDLTLMLLPILLVINSPRRVKQSAWCKVLAVCAGFLYIPPVYVLLTMWGAFPLTWLVLLAFTTAIFALAVRKPELAQAGAVLVRTASEDIENLMSTRGPQ